MKKKLIIIISIVTLVAIMATVVAALFYSQYNTKGISHFMIVGDDLGRGKELIGNVGNDSVYVEGFASEDLYFLTVNSNKILVKDALSQNMVKPNDWVRHAYSATTKNNIRVLTFDDYEIAVKGHEYLVRPKSE